MPLHCKYCKKQICENIDDALEGTSKYIECPHCGGLMCKTEFNWRLD